MNCYTGFFDQAQHIYQFVPSGGNEWGMCPEQNKPVPHHGGRQTGDHPCCYMYGDNPFGTAVDLSVSWDLRRAHDPHTGSKNGMLKGDANALQHVTEGSSRGTENAKACTFNGATQQQFWSQPRPHMQWDPKWLSVTGPAPLDAKTDDQDKVVPCKAIPDWQLVKTAFPASGYTASHNIKTKKGCVDQSINDCGFASVTPAQKFKCLLCSKTYCRRSTLKAHLRQHSGERPYVCGSCGKTFSQAANLTAHRRIHTGEKPFACPICARPFSQSSSLVTHKRTHTGERPYRCPGCEKCFTDSSTLTKHLRTHTGQKPYECSVCFLRFSQSGNLNRHHKTHIKQRASAHVLLATERGATHT